MTYHPTSYFIIGQLDKQDAPDKRVPAQQSNTSVHTFPCRTRRTQTPHDLRICNHTSIFLNSSSCTARPETKQRRWTRYCEGAALDKRVCTDGWRVTRVLRRPHPRDLDPKSCPSTSHHTRIPTHETNTYLCEAERQDSEQRRH